MITGPELDLLQEVLAEDPTADVYLDVAHALLDQGETRKAATVLRRALEHGVRDLQTARMLAQAAGEIGDDRGIRVAADALGESVMRSDPVLARAYAIALDRAGDLDKAGDLARTLLDQHGADAALDAIIERQNAPLPDISIRANDPFFTVRRAEAYLESGRPDLAVRAYRRILAANPGDQALHARLLRLRAMPRESRPWVDDLSEEYWVGRPMSALAMPSPTLVPAPPIPDDEITIPAVPLRDLGPGGHPLHADPVSEFEDEEATAVMSLEMLERTAEQARMRGGGHASALMPQYDDFDDEEATTIMRADQLQQQTRLRQPEEDSDEEATVMMGDRARRAMQRPRSRMPGVDDLRRAIDEDSDLDEDEDAFDGDGDADSIIEQARAIEQRAADRRRRTLFRK